MVFGLFREAKTLSFWDNDNVQGQLSQHIFAPNGGCFVYFILQIFFATRKVLKLEEYYSNIPQFKLRNTQSRDTIASIWHENMLGNLSFDIICSSRLTVLLEVRFRKAVCISKQIMSVDNPNTNPKGQVTLWKPSSFSIFTSLEGTANLI